MEMVEKEKTNEYTETSTKQIPNKFVILILEKFVLE